MSFKRPFLPLFILLCLILSCSKKYGESVLQFKTRLTPLLEEETIKDLVDRSQVHTSTRATSPHIFFFLLDTVRDDYVSEVDTPNIYQFSQESIYPEMTLAGATATHHSFYSFFFSRPAYERIPMINKGWHLGSPFLYILKQQLDYKINLLGFPSFLFPLNNIVPKDQVLSDESSNQLNFGAKTSLVDSFQEMGWENYYTKNYGDSDRALTDQLIGRLETIKNASSPQFTFTYYFSAHDPYSYSSDFPISRLLTPHYPQAGQPKLTTLFQGQTAMIVNSYRNGIRNIDRQFGRFIKKLKELNLYNNSIIVVMSDHGELLGERGTFGHGGNTVRETAHSTLMIKPQLGKALPAHSFASNLDIFPTLLDLLDMEYEKNYAPHFFGKSLLTKRKKYSSIVIRPNLQKPTHYFALVNDNYKVFGKLKYDNEDIMTASSFQIEAITDLYDHEISLGSTMDAVNDRIRADFSGVLKKMFPEQ